MSERAPVDPSQQNVCPLGENPYWVFVSFLYAWVAADIAQRFSYLSLHWSEVPRIRPESYWHVTIWMHLVLAAFLIATSWLGWTLTFTKGDVTGLDINKLDGVIAPSSLLLIVDFWLLGTYFAFVSDVNEARLSGSHIGTWSPCSGLAAYWISWILFVYLVWDFLAYFLIPLWDTKETKFWVKSWMSFPCLLFAVGAFFMLRDIRPDRPLWIFAGDWSLIALILSYRGLKQQTVNKASEIKKLIKTLLSLKGNWELWVPRGAFFVFLALATLACLYGH